MAIGSNSTTLSFDDVVSSLLLEEVRLKNMENQMPYLKEDSPKKETDPSPQVGDLNLRDDLNLLKNL